ncbi:MAG TPA: cytochrome c oxidase subunit II [Solirubrobacteraceae bacterium]|nr:cytochrome c oxidase subunit II [Solirubrobacteraceae bacterium]
MRRVPARPGMSTPRASTVRRVPRRAIWGGLATACVLLAGCGGRQSTLNPRSKPAHDITTLWWWMLAVAGVVFLGAVVMLLVAYLRREPGLPFLGEREQLSTGLVVVFGMAIPIVILVALFIVANLDVLKATSAPRASSTKLTIKVIGHQWFWEVRYPGTAAVTANEIHIPTGTRVNVEGTTDDVIHSFWVPELNRKIDLIPGRVNRVLLYTNRPGVYRGQCAEFCGDQHAHMSFAVFADPPARFRAWLANEAAPAHPQPAGLAQAGERTFMGSQCASCHTIRGTPANGHVGPDLTHFGSRTALAAEMLLNKPNNVARWVRDPQHFKPGAKMPGLDLTQAQLGAIVPYLESLK